jgi:hypothetical protein
MKSSDSSHGAILITSAETPQSPDGRPGYSLGASPSLIAGLQEHEASTARHWFGMHVAGLQGEAAEMLRGFCILAAINMADMMERR